MDNSFYELYSCFSYFLMGGFYNRVISDLRFLFFPLPPFKMLMGCNFKPPLEMRNRINL
jgi:hypothetical protein